MFRFWVTPDDGEQFEVEAIMRDVLKWEKTSKGRTIKSLEGDASLVDLYKIAHIACQRTNQFTGSLQEFEDSVDIEFEEQEEPETPMSGGV